MSIQDKIAKKLVREHGEILGIHTASNWHLDLKDLVKNDDPPTYQTCRIGFGRDRYTSILCHVADNMDLQIAGLQRFARLAEEEGMIFPYDEPRRAQFHMGSVSFPIDIIFVGDDGRITKKVESIEPGTPGMWGMPHISAVIETNGGFCKKHNIEVGTEVYELIEKTAQFAEDISADTATQLFPQAITKLINKGDIVDDFQFYIYFDTLGACPVDGESPEIYWNGENWIIFNSPQAKYAQEFFTPEPRRDINPKMVPSNPTKDRFRDRDLGDQTTQNQPMTPHHHEQYGNDLISLHDQDDVAPIRPS